VAERVQKATGASVAGADGDPGDTGEQPADAAVERGLRQEVVPLPMAQRGFVLLLCCWVGERSNAGMARIRRRARDDERRPEDGGGRAFPRRCDPDGSMLIAFKVQRT
jgi:hypothetical protein